MVIFERFGILIFIECFALKWPGLKDFFWFSEMEEVEAHKTEILNH